MNLLAINLPYNEFNDDEFTMVNLTDWDPMIGIWSIGGDNRQTSGTRLSL